MTTFSDIRQVLQQKIDRLPDCQLQEVLEFVNNLPSQIPASLEKDSYYSDSQVDPLSEFIGAVHHGSLAQNIDRELYG